MSTSVSPRVFSLLAEARRAVALRGRLHAAGKETSAVDEALETLYRDLGRAVVHAAETQDGLAFPTLRRIDSSDWELEEEDDDWYSDDETQPGPRPAIVDPIFAPHELDDITDVPESDGAVFPVDDLTESERRTVDFEVTSLALASRVAAEPSSALYALARGQVDAWVSRVRQLVTLLALPPRPDDPDELRVELSRLQWATTDLTDQLGGLPSEVQVAFIGLLGARARHLKARVDSDVAPRLVIDRLQRYRIGASLPSVAALLPTARPELGSWADDVRGWWGLLAVR
jgi:hypothetical protein